MPREYNEEFIWRDLKLRGEKFLGDLRAHWRTRKKLPRVAYAWPGGALRDDAGDPLDFVTLLLPEGESSPTLRKLVARTDAYAFLVVEPGQGEVTVLLESGHGTVRWTLPFKPLLDLTVLGAPKVEEGVPGYGILWRG